MQRHTLWFYSISSRVGSRFDSIIIIIFHFAFHNLAVDSSSTKVLFEKTTL